MRHVTDDAFVPSHSKIVRTSINVADWFVAEQPCQGTEINILAVAYPELVSGGFPKLTN